MDRLLPFKVRGREVTRLEAFSDAVFGFAATLLVVSLEVPRTYDALLVSLRGFVPFAASFALLIWMWSIHNGFFRRYGMQDAVTVALNATLLFVILFFVYPMRVVMTSFIERVMWGMGLISGDAFTFALDGSMSQLSQLFAIYSAGFTSVFACFTLLYRRALKKADEMGLDELERFDASSRRTEMAIYAAVGALGLLIGLTGLGARLAMGGWIYCVLGPMGAWWGVRRAKARAIIRARIAAAESPAAVGDQP
jgi:hypothetical protein